MTIDNMTNNLYKQSFEHCTTVINSCKTQEQLKDARNLVDNFLKLNGENSMHQWIILMNQILNKEMIINYASKDSE